MVMSWLSWEYVTAAFVIYRLPCVQFIPGMLPCYYYIIMAKLTSHCALFHFRSQPSAMADLQTPLVQPKREKVLVDYLLRFASARADRRRMPARIRRLRPWHPQGGAATITYPTMGLQQYMVEPPSTSLTFPDFAAALNSLSLDWI